MSRDSTHAGGMSPLQHLILETMRSKGWGPGDVEERGVKHATLHRYMNPVTMKALPRQQIINDLAAALDLTPERVRQAAMESLSFAPEVRPEPPLPRRLRSVETGDDPTNPVLDAIRNDTLLLPEAREHLLNQYQLLLRVQGPASDRLPYAARGQRTGAVDDAEEQRIQSEVERAARSNPASPHYDPTGGAE